MSDSLPAHQARSAPGQSQPKAPGRWLCVAVGDKGDSLYWKGPYTALESIRSHFCELECYGEEKVGVTGMLEGLLIFMGLQDCAFPPLYKESDFDEVSHMRFGESLGWRENRWVGFSAAAVKIYIWSTKREAVLSEARILDRRLAFKLQLLEIEKTEKAPTPTKKRRKKPGSPVAPPTRD